MEELGSLLKRRAKRIARPAPHEKAAAVDEILLCVKDEKVQKSYAYWLGLLKRSGLSYGDVMAIVKKASGLPAKYNRGGYITNRLRDFASRNEPPEPCTPTR